MGTKQRIGNEFTDRARVHFPVARFGNIRAQLFPLTKLMSWLLKLVQVSLRLYTASVR